MEDQSRHEHSGTTESDDCGQVRKERAGRLYRIYVLELRPELWAAEAKFRKANPDYVAGMPLVYVGSTGKSIEDRIASHLGGGHQSNRFVAEYYLRPLPWEFVGIRPRDSRAAAERREERKALALRRRGWGVWYGVKRRARPARG